MIRRLAAIGSVMLSLAVLQVHAQHRDAGTTLFNFTNINYDARTVALAGASVALANDGYGLFTNPAAIAFVGSMQAVAGFRPVGSGVYGSPIACILPRKGIGVFGLGIYGLTSGNIEITDIGPDGGILLTDEMCRADNIAGSAAGARRINEYLSYGAAIKWLYTSIKGFEDGSPVRWSADGFACDVGFQGRFYGSRLIYGIVLRNLGFIRSRFENGEEGYSLPLGMDLGVSYVPRYIEDLRMVLDLSKKSKDYLSFRPGFEWEVLRRQLVLRGGYSFSCRDLVAFKKTLSGDTEESYIKSSMTGICLGAGLTAELAGRKVIFDSAAEFLTIPVPPSIVLSVLFAL